ncbi:membrane protein insertion efficiency factor YidD [Methylosoma difficile]
MMRYAAAASISAYQKYLSPHKGFCCAYRHKTGRHSCSEFAKRIALRHGVIIMLRALPRQLARCKTAYQNLSLNAATVQKKQRRHNKDKSSALDCLNCDICNCLELPVQIFKSTNCETINICDVGPCDCSF